MISAGWWVLYAAHRNGRLAVEGPYARVRHPQYTGFILIMVGFLLQWPTLPTLVMFPALLHVDRRLAVREETEMRSRFPQAWSSHAAPLPRFVPPHRRRTPMPSPTAPAMSATTPSALNNAVAGTET